jgi:hypothetical protein
MKLSEFIALSEEEKRAIVLQKGLPLQNETYQITWYFFSSSLAFMLKLFVVIRPKKSRSTGCFTVRSI